MGRRSRKRYKKPIRRMLRLPTRFQCPSCGLPTLSIEIKTYETEEGFEYRKAFMRCLNPECGLRAIMEEVPRIFQEVDVYAKFLDMFTEGKIPIKYVKGEEWEEYER